MTAPAILYRVAADRLPRVDLTFEGQDLSLYSSIKMRVRREDGTLVERDAVVDDAPNGLCHFDWSAGDLTEGQHTAEFRFVLAAGSLPLTIPRRGALFLIVRGQV